MNHDRLFGACFGVLSLLFLILLVPQLGAGGGGFAGAGFYSVAPTALPYFSGAMVLLFSVLLLLGVGSHRPDAVKEETTLSSTAELEAPTSNLVHGLLFAGVTLLYVVGMSYIGFLFASIVFLGVIFVFYRPASWKIAVLLTFIIPLIVDVTLRKLFLVPLPSSVLF